MPESTAAPSVRAIDETLTTGPAAKRLHCSTQTIRDYIAQGRIRAFRVGPRNYRIPISELDRLVTEVEAA